MTTDKVSAEMDSICTELYIKQTEQRLALAIAVVDSVKTALQFIDGNHLDVGFMIGVIAALIEFDEFELQLSELQR